MVDIKTKETEAIKQQSNVTSPISKGADYKSTKQNTGILAWLNDNDVVDENDGKIDNSVAVTSFVKGLFEMVKTVYKKPYAAVLTVIVGAILAINVGYSAVALAMKCAIVAGAAGIVYAFYSIATSKISNDTKSAYEILGASAVILALGIYGLIA